MPEQQTTKNSFDLSGGLNTELNEISWPDGFTADEANYELLSDGTRRRRKGLATEAGNTAEPVATITATQFNQSFKWKNVGGDPDKAFLVHQIGSELYFTNDDETPSASWHSIVVPVDDHAAETTPTDALMSDKPLRFSQGRGHLFVTGPYVLPFFVTYDASGDTFSTTPIEVRYRDFVGIDDGVGMESTPADDPIDADHSYNLRNRGWKGADLLTLLSTNSVSPAKNGLWYTAYSRAEGTGTNFDPEGDLALDEVKYLAEVFANSTAPQGSLFLNPFDTRFSVGGGGNSAAKPIEAVVTGVVVTTLGSLQLTITGHGFSNGDEVTVSGQQSLYIKRMGKGGHTREVKWDYNGTWTVRDKQTNTFELDVTPPYNWDSWSDLDEILGEVEGGVALANSEGSLVERGFEAIGFHAGRVWYAGLADGQFADHVFFSRICEKPLSYGQCFQEADPTGRDFNEITPADGGVLVVPGLSGVKDMMTIGNSLVLVGTEGAWEISGDRGATFTATRFGVRQLTNANFNSPTGAIAIEDSGIATGPSGIYQFAPNEFTRLLEAKNMIRDTIQTKWNGYTTAQQVRAQVAYDDAKLRLYLMIGATATDNRYTEILIFDIRQTAWFRYTFTDQLAAATAFGLLTMVAISDADDSSSNQKMKFVIQPSADTLDIADFEQTDYLDYDALESPLPYMVTGFDNLGDFQRRKQTPVITVIQRRTETGFNAALDTAINASRTLMTAFWDWTEAIEYANPLVPAAPQRAFTGTAGNHGVSGKIGAQSQVYRHNRSFIPLATGDVDGYPVVVTRNKVRGRGRVLQLRFDGAATFDSHLIGWQTNYKVTVRK